MRKTRLNRTVAGFFAAITSLMLAPAVQAQMSTTTSASSDYSFYAPGSGYVGIAAGRSRYHYPSGANAFINDKNASAWSVYGGSYFSSHVGFELGYNDFGRLTRAGGTTKANGISLSLVGRLPLSSSFNLLGRLGGTYVHTDISAVTGSGVTPGPDNKFDISYGIGAEWAFSPKASAILQYDGYNMRYINSGRELLNTATVGLRYRF